MNRLNRRVSQAMIDMTPLMDLTFMLLIVFVITMPAMYYKSDVRLKPPESTTNDRMKVEDNSLFVELDRDGMIWIGRGNNRRSESMPSEAELTQTLQALHERLPELVVYLVGDKDRRYDEVIRIANAVQRANIDSLSLVFNPETQKE